MSLSEGNWSGDELIALLHELNERKEKNRLRLLNLKQMVKVFLAEISRNKNVLPNYDAKVFKELKQFCEEVDVS